MPSGGHRAPGSYVILFIELERQHPHSVPLGTGLCALRQPWSRRRQVDIATLVRRGGEAAGGFMGSGGDGVRDPLPMLLGCSDADAEAGGPGSSGLAVVPREEGGTGGSGGWCATCLVGGGRWWHVSAAH